MFRLVRNVEPGASGCGARGIASVQQSRGAELWRSYRFHGHFQKCNNPDDRNANGNPARSSSRFVASSECQSVRRRCVSQPKCRSSRTVSGTTSASGVRDARLHALPNGGHELSSDAGRSHGNARHSIRSLPQNGQTRSATCGSVRGMRLLRTGEGVPISRDHAEEPCEQGFEKDVV